MKLYIIRNKEGKFFRSIGYGGSGTNWVEKIEDSKVYFKFGQAKGRVTFFYKRWPEFGCPEILEFNIDIKEAICFDMEEITNKKIDRAKKTKLKRQQEYKKYQIEVLNRQKEEIEKKLKNI